MMIARAAGPLTVILGAVWLLGWQPPGERPRVLSVAEICKDLGAWSGARVRLQGVYHYGLRAMNPRATLVAGGRTWPMALDLETPSDTTAARALDRAILDAVKSGKGELVLTLRGTLHGPSSHWVPNAGLAVAGYGHLGAFPAQLVVEQVERVEFRRVPTYDYALLLPARAW